MSGWESATGKGSSMNLGLRDKVALVTGASRGIGSAIAAELAREGCQVILVARGREKLDQRVAEIRAEGGKAVAYASDLREPAAITALLAEVNGQFGGVDILVANAGSASMGHFLELTDADWHEGFALKFFGHMRLIRSAWPQLKAKHGAVVMIAGAAGRTPAATAAVTGAVNAALLNLTKTLATLGIGDGVRVNAINPGAIKTDRYFQRIRNAVAERGETEAEAERRMAAERGNAPVGEPQDIADLVCFLVSERGKNLQGAIIDSDGGKTRTL